MLPSFNRNIFFCFFSFLCLPLLSLKPIESREQIANEMSYSIKNELLDKWYPQSIDKKYGGFVSTYTFDFKPTGTQPKMIVNQARHTWTNAMASMRYPESEHYIEGARHGYEFLKNVFWDSKFGGFYTLVSQEGKLIDADKTAYGNAIAIYALAAYYKASKDTGALNMAKKTFHWLERHSHDALHDGYFQDLHENGSIKKRTLTTPSTSTIGYKDQNSSIHLLEAFTELYQLWPDKLLKQRLEEMLVIIRDRIVTKKGFMTLFFFPDWQPISFRDSSQAVIVKHRMIDHVSFGHDVETAYLLLEASHTLGLKQDKVTMKVAKKMVDHCLENGWDNLVGGFYEQGYYFKGKSNITILRESKNWWSQAEGMNTLLLMADHFPKDPQRYYEKFELLWKYTQTYLIDHNNGDWYEEGIDKDPQRRTALKGHAWKATDHHYRALANCIDRLRKKV